MSGRDPRDVPPVRAADISFRQMRDADIAAGLQLCRMAGWDQVQRDWERFVAAENGTAHVGLMDGHLIGTVATIRYGVEFGWIGMVLVHPDVQGRGVGAVLLDHATAQLTNVPAIRLDATPAGQLLYRKHAFIEEYSLKRMEGVPSVVNRSNPSWVRPLTRETLTDVTALDRLVFGAPRAELLAWMYDGAPEYGFAAHQGGRVTGYVLGRQGHEFEHLGPIVAGDSAVAVELTKACLVDHPGRAFVIDSAGDAEEWLRFLEETGFREQRPYIRMHRGHGGPFGRRDQQFAILGPEFG
jgi:GNAT superfamily N-acetyltransferase